MAIRAVACLLILAGAVSGAGNTAAATGENDDMSVVVTLYIDPAGVNEVVGATMEPHYIVADVKLTPKPGKEVFVDRDDFLLRTDKDGEKTRPFAPNQIAGGGGLVVTRRSENGSAAGVGPSRRLPIDSPWGRPDVVGGVGGAVESGKVDATMSPASAGKEKPLLETLKARELPQGKTSAPVAGLLYFGMEKQKMKNLEVVYGGRQNRISLRFK